MKRVCAIHQPHYLPWLRYFDKIARADVFVLLDDAQFNKNGWQNRNKVKGPEGWCYLTVPVRHRSGCPINEVLIDSKHNWARKHRRTVDNFYAKAAHFHGFAPLLHDLLGRRWERLVDLNVTMLERFLTALGIDRPVHHSSRLGVSGSGTARLAGICKAVGATHYLTGAYAVEAYLDIELFQREGVEVIYQDWAAPHYRQLYPQAGFIGDLSIIDLLLNHGPKSLDILFGTAGPLDAPADLTGSV